MNITPSVRLRPRANGSRAALSGAVADLVGDPQHPAPGLLTGSRLVAEDDPETSALETPALLGDIGHGRPLLAHCIHL
ncbi:hypothetical protein ACRAWF_20295 [Streptomyces sp. L7]